MALDWSASFHASNFFHEDNKVKRDNEFQMVGSLIARNERK